jgi:lipid II:glycine glycyltransferase (peptidoglycan interpeptide bridge formation enzyme)
MSENNDKIYDLLTKMYSEFSEFKKEMLDFKQDMTGFKQDTTSRLGKIEISLEHDIKPKIKLCLDELVTVKEKLQEHDLRFDKIDERFDRIDAKLAIHDAEIITFKRVK